MITNEDIESTYRLGLNRNEVAARLGISARRVRAVLKGKFRTRKEYQFFINKKKAHPLDAKKLQCILGTLLGDGSFFINRGIPVLSISHCGQQKEYLEHKRKIIGAPPLMSCYKDQKSYSSGSIFYRMSYNNRWCLDQIANIVLVNNRKIVNKKWVELLEIEGIAYWFMDDGFSSFAKSNYPKVNAGFSTQSFSDREVRLLRRRLTDFGIQTTKTKRPKGFNINISRHSVNNFMKQIEPFLVDCMYYKLKYSVYAS